ncbi:MAG: hypothetical protein QGH90_01235 [Candidatus Poseidoniaceae archaeon]|nr:hypothetical protein [Candidatus Poseidoniaceae archaeon]MDP7000503.1 hypothetical protein [Candidatus Poseidoniaceae archaeon]
MTVPDSVLHSLHLMEGYDQMLAMDQIAREHGISPEQLQAELQAFIQRGAANPVGIQPTAATNQSAIYNPSVGEAPAHKVDGFDDSAMGVTTPPAMASSAPRYIDDPSKLRMRYDPSREGGDRQAEISQAILCPTCSAPLGIPALRPIKVTCPNCATESLFEN